MKHFQIFWYFLNSGVHLIFEKLPNINQEYNLDGDTELLCVRLANRIAKNMVFWRPRFIVFVCFYSIF